MSYEFVVLIIIHTNYISVTHINHNLIIFLNLSSIF